MNKSDSITNLAAALAKAQAEFKPAELNSTNPFLKNKFADLGAVIEAARPALAKNGLSVIQFPVGGGEGIGLETIIAHESGEWISETVYLALTEERGKSNAQVAGSLITYLRRYALSSTLGIYAGDDTDGTAHNTATQQTTQRAAAQPERAPLPQTTLPPQPPIPSKQNGGSSQPKTSTEFFTYAKEQNAVSLAQEIANRHAKNPDWDKSFAELNDLLVARNAQQD